MSSDSAKNNNKEKSASSLGCGSLLALAVLVAAVSVYLSSPEGPQQVEKYVIQYTKIEANLCNFLISSCRVKWIENETDPQHMTKWVCLMEFDK